MHFKGHVDSWCHENCDPNKFKELDKVGYHSSYAIKYECPIAVTNIRLFTGVCDSVLNTNTIIAGFYL